MCVCEQCVLFWDRRLETGDGATHDQVRRQRYGPAVCAHLSSQLHYERGIGRPRLRCEPCSGSRANWGNVLTTAAPGCESLIIPVVLLGHKLVRRVRRAHAGPVRIPARGIWVQGRARAAARARAMGSETSSSRASLFCPIQRAELILDGAR